MEQFRILGLSGSLRKASYNSAALSALSALAPAHIEVVVFEGMADLPLFNPDREDERIPAVAALRSQLKNSDGLIIASPEYAHGISGVLKNALDWSVSGEEFVHMPVMFINTSPRAHHALAALHEVVKTMSGQILENACVAIPLLGSNLDAKGILAHPEISASLHSSLITFCAEIATLEQRNRFPQPASDQSA